MPLTIFNTKNDELLNELNAREISIEDKPSKHGGVYMVRPRPDDDDAAVKKYLQRVFENEEHALYIDEGYMMGIRNPKFRLLLTQGRAKHTPMTYLSQRPAWMDRFAFSEARYFAIFRLTDNDDVKTVKRFANVPLDRKLAKHHFVWYDVNSDAGAIIKPVPSPTTIINTFNSRFPKPRSFF